MLEHLDDPTPPTPTARELAIVLGRSAKLRRRRAASVLTVLGVVALVLGIFIGSLVPRPPSSLRVTVTDLASHSGALAAGLEVPTADVVSAVFPDDQHGFALTVGTHKTALVATTDGGNSWQVVQGHLPVNSEAQLDFANLSHGYLWGTSAQSGVTVPLWVTVDGGKSWAKAPIGPVVSDVTAIGASVWAVVGTCPLSSQSGAPSCPVALEVSSDGGTTWAESDAAPPLLESAQTSYDDQDIELVRMTTAHAYVLTFDPAGQDTSLDRIVYTSDTGKAWTDVPDPCPQTFGFSSELAGSGSDDLWLICATQPSAGSQGKALYRSYDGGGTWALVSQTAASGISGGTALPATGGIALSGYVAPVSLGHRNLAVISSTEAWLFPDRGGVYETTDGGSTWRSPQSLTAAGFSSLGTSGDIVFADPTHGWVDEPGAGVWRTTDGTTWKQLGP
jgi:photosystem II stability/assembly factor-like uncharacterized protein